MPYGFAQVLERLAEIGYHGIEFAGYTQSTAILGRQITPAEIRQILDDNGLIAVGGHGSIPAPQRRPHMAAFEAHIENALTLGQTVHRHGQRPDRQQLQGRLGRGGRALEHARRDRRAPTG